MIGFRLQTLSKYGVLCLPLLACLLCWQIIGTLSANSAYTFAIIMRPRNCFSSISLYTCTFISSVPAMSESSSDSRCEYFCQSSQKPRFTIYRLIVAI